MGPFTLQRDDGQSLTLVGVPNTQTTASTTIVPARAYTVTWGVTVPPKPRLFLNQVRTGDWARLTVPYPTANIRIIRDYDSGHPMAQAASAAAVDAATDAAWFYDTATGLVHLKLVTQANRNYAGMFIEPL